MYRRERWRRMEKEWHAIRDWTNKIFSFHQKAITKTTLEELKQALFTHTKQAYYTFKTNEQRSIIISFSQGEVIIKQKDGQLFVEIDEETKKKVYELKKLIQERKINKAIEIKEEDNHDNKEEKKDEQFEAFVSFSEEIF